MLYVQRGDDGKIVALHNSPSPAATEEKSFMDEEVMAFLAATDAWAKLLARSDAGTVRVLEDLIDLLVRKNVINFTELPDQAQRRINERRALREKIVSNDLLVHDII